MRKQSTSCDCVVQANFIGARSEGAKYVGTACSHIILAYDDRVNEFKAPIKGNHQVTNSTVASCEFLEVYARVRNHCSLHVSMLF